MKSLPSILVLAATLTLASCSSTLTSQSEDAHAPTSVSPAEALARLKAGNDRYVSERHARHDDPSHLRAVLAKGQQPFAVVLGCSDSRTAPEIIFDQQLGSLFVCRVAGNVTDPVVLGSIEYAVEHLHSPLIVVLGHSKCGAVTAALAGGHAEGNIGSLLHEVHIGKNLPADRDAKLDTAIASNATHHERMLTSRSPVIRKLVSEGKVRVASGVYSLDSGKVTWQ